NAEDIVARCRTELRHAGGPEASGAAGAGIFGDIDLPRVGMAAAAAVAVILAGLWMFEGGGDSAGRMEVQAPQVLPGREGADGARLASPVPSVPSGPGIAAAMPPPPPPAPQQAAQRGPAPGSTDPTAAQAASPLPGSAQPNSAQPN